MAQELSAVIKLLIYAALKGIQYNEADYQLQVRVIVQVEDVG